MATKNFQKIIAEINRRATTHPIGKLQEIRKDIKGLKRLPTHSLFTSLTIFDHYAFHHGGRTELQFNIGAEDSNEFRFGVAFSLQTNQTLPNVEDLIPKIKLFNDFIQLYPDEFSDMRMWYYNKGKRSADYIPKYISSDLLIEGVFIFLGKRQKLAKPDYEHILHCLDRLLPLYQYVESNGALPSFTHATQAPFVFRSGFSTFKARTAKASQAQRELDIDLRHNLLQEALCRKLSAKFGAKNVGAENPSGNGTNIDVVVKHKNDYWFYEIKTAQSPRACIRQAIGQLLEYAFWPRSRAATRLIVVGETALDGDGKEYLRELRERFSLPIEYEQIAI